MEIKRKAGTTEKKPLSRKTVKEKNSRNISIKKRAIFQPKNFKKLKWKENRKNPAERHWRKKKIKNPEQFFNLEFQEINIKRKRRARIAEKQRRRKEIKKHSSSKSLENLSRKTIKKKTNSRTRTIFQPIISRNQNEKKKQCCVRSDGYSKNGQPGMRYAREFSPREFLQREHFLSAPAVFFLPLNNVFFI